MRIERRLARCTAACLALATQAALAAPPTDPSQVPALRPGVLAGYMAAGSWVDSLALLPPPPDAGSALQAADDAAYKNTRQLKDAARGAQAARDAVLAFPKAAEHFQCALGVAISEQATPNLNMLLRRSYVDAGLATYKAKDHYKRQRPFVVANEATCTPNEEASLRRDGSYPSGHAALGWAWGLILTEVAPERTNAVMQRAYAYGQSRVICGVHWQSDVDAGRMVGAAAVAQLHSNADFNQQLALARAEVAAARSANLAPSLDCAAEAQALGSAPAGTGK